MTGVPQDQQAAIRPQLITTHKKIEMLQQQQSYTGLTGLECGQL